MLGRWDFNDFRWISELFLHISMVYPLSPGPPGSLTISAAASFEAIVEGRFKTPPLDQIGLDGLTGRQRWIRWRRRWDERSRGMLGKSRRIIGEVR